MWFWLDQLCCSGLAKPSSWENKYKEENTRQHVRWIQSYIPHWVLPRVSGSAIMWPDKSIRRSGHLVSSQIAPKPHLAVRKNKPELVLIRLKRLRKQIKSIHTTKLCVSRQSFTNMFCKQLCFKVVCREILKVCLAYVVESESWHF